MERLIRLPIRAFPALLAAALLAAPALADPAAPSPAGDAVAGWEALGASELASHRGGADTLVLQEANLTSDVTGNVVGDGVRGGAITVSDEAFGGFQGFQSNIVNSGHNVSAQSSMNVILNLY